MGEVEQANRALDQAWDTGGKKRPELFASAFAQVGGTAMARRILASMEERFGKGEAVLGWQAFEAYYYLGEHHEALTWLMRAIEDRQVELFPRLRADRYSALRDSPRFQDAMRRLEAIESPPDDFQTMALR